MALNKEIERKWLVDKDKIPFDFSACRPLKMEQSYISFSPTIRIRNTNNENYVLCVKTKGKAGSIARDEFETEISKEQYDSLLQKIEGTIIKKTRYCIKSDDGYTMEFDFFEGALSGLCYMEIEFPDEETALSYPTPAWAIKDVSSDFRYKNAGLAKFGMPI